MRISDWSSDVCSSDLGEAEGRGGHRGNDDLAHVIPFECNDRAAGHGQRVNRGAGAWQPRREACPEKERGRRQAVDPFLFLRPRRGRKEAYFLASSIAPLAASAASCAAPAASAALEIGRANV